MVSSSRLAVQMFSTMLAARGVSMFIVFEPCVPGYAVSMPPDELCALRSPTRTTATESPFHELRKP